MLDLYFYNILSQSSFLHSNLPLTPNHLLSISSNININPNTPYLRNDIYGQTWGPGYFYEKQEAYNAFDARLRFILNYKGKYSGKVWKSWNAAIMAFDLQNEPFSAKQEECNYPAAATWVCGRSKTLRSVLGSGSAIKIATGGFGGDISGGCTFIKSAMSCPELDIIAGKRRFRSSRHNYENPLIPFSKHYSLHIITPQQHQHTSSIKTRQTKTLIPTIIVHRYAGSQASNPNQWSNSYNSWLGQTNGKLVFLEEWGVNTKSLDAKSEFPANTRDMNNAGLPWLYWQFLPSKKCTVGDSDPFGFFVDSGVDIAGQVKAASNANSRQDWSGIVY